MRQEVDRAIELRIEGKHKESNEILLTLVKVYPEDSFINYQCAWSFDVLGEESQAVPFYEKAIQLGLPEQELEGAFIGLGSTYRTLGYYEKSKKIFLKAMEQFPDNRAIQVFYSMTLYNLKEHDGAMELLLKCLTDTTVDQEILSYKKAVGFYSDKLDHVWS
ncbi:tetratricopeptide repeat protein [Sporosarcina sp. ANT_H38]|uniref:tetratricopeptide repeat protein n=1 Tax=Sporosarcina sp. ANT_H38 TaxID=2597358 RepID=UPI0011F0B0DE|nr:tetratricopeptide repeat protein [Sporosarcina sp. ANT_H38]KAA0965705.1 tetratricopeptide repeat protein [Sporosarcina sp. ANT_H38]